MNCTVCGNPRAALNREKTSFGSCISISCSDPLKDYDKEQDTAQIHALTTLTPAQMAARIIEHERTQVAEGVHAIKETLKQREWLTEGRGPYEWDDDKWHDEFAAAFEEILTALKPLEKIAADFRGCPTSSLEVQAARLGPTLLEQLQLSDLHRGYTMGQEAALRIAQEAIAYRFAPPVIAVVIPDIEPFAWFFSVLTTVALNSEEQQLRDDLVHITAKIDSRDRLKHLLVAYRRALCERQVTLIDQLKEKSA